MWREADQRAVRAGQWREETFLQEAISTKVLVISCEERGTLPLEAEKIFFFINGGKTP